MNLATIQMSSNLFTANNVMLFNSNPLLASDPMPSISNPMLASDPMPSISNSMFASDPMPSITQDQPLRADRFSTAAAALARFNKAN